MNPVIPAAAQAIGCGAAAPAIGNAGKWATIVTAIRRRPETLLFAGLLAFLNWPVFTGAVMESMVFRPDAVLAGEWWRVLMHPFVHVTWYHLLLDGAAFLMLVHSLMEPSLGRRISYIIAGSAGSLLISWWAAPAISTIGLCGLSGVAHGLMAVSSLELLASQPLHSKEARYGVFAFILVTGKAALEALNGRMFFDFMHFGLMGNPVAVAHAGGIIGALLPMLWFQIGAWGSGHSFRFRPKPN